MTVAPTARLHTVCVRHTTSERKSLQAYYGHRNRPSEVAPHPGQRTLCVPPRLWRDHANHDVREFFGGRCASPLHAMMR